MPGRSTPKNFDLAEVGERAQREFGKRLSKARRNKGLKQMTLGRHLGLSRTSISNIERGDQRVSLELVYQAALCLGVSLEELLPALEEVVEPMGARVRTASDVPLVPAAEEEALKLVQELQKDRLRRNQLRARQNE